MTAALQGKGQMQKPKLRNHVVTRGYLTNWLSRNSSGDQGIWYFDLLERKLKFSPGKKASFAIKKSLYAGHGLRSAR